jgi:hypothetical protein
MNGHRIHKDLQKHSAHWNKKWNTKYLRKSENHTNALAVIHEPTFIEYVHLLQILQIKYNKVVKKWGVFDTKYEIKLGFV